MDQRQNKNFFSVHRLSLFWVGLVVWLILLWLFNFNLLSAAAGFLLFLALFINLPQKYILATSGIFGGISLAYLSIYGLNSVVGNYVLVMTFFLLLIAALVSLRTQLVKTPRWPLATLSGRGTWLAVIIITFVAFFLVQPVLRQPGFIFSGDFAFPFSLSNYWQDNVNAWSVSRGISVFGDFGHLFYLGPLVGLASIGGGMEWFLKILIVVPYLAAGLSMLFLARKVFREVYPSLAAYHLPVALTAAVIYQLNPWIIDHQPHYFLQVGYAFLPLTLLFMVIAWERRNFWWIFLAALVFATTTVTPHYVVYTAVVLLILFLVNGAADCWRQNWRRALRRLGITLAIAVLALFFSAFWLCPLVSVQLNNGTLLAPDYVLRMEDITAANARLSWQTAFQLSTPDLQNADSHWVWEIASYGLPILAAAGLVLNYRRRWAIMILLVLLAAWSVPLTFIFFPGVYSNLMYHLPLSWIFHDPARTLGLVCLGYSILIGLFILGLIAHQRSKITTAENNAK